MFELEKKDKNSRARTGILKTDHGEARTPSYVIVGTRAEVRCISGSDIASTKTQIVISNTYHLWKQMGNKGLKKYKGLHNALGWNGIVMTDSGGFQVFSLGAGRVHKVGKIALVFPGHKPEDPGFSEKLRRFFFPRVGDVRIYEKGVKFWDEGFKNLLTPELSIRIQEQLKGNIILPLDECTSPFHDREYTGNSLERTHRWALRSLEAKSKKNQKLFGIVQGGEYEDLRKKSARFIGSLPFDGFAIGGSLGNFKEDMFKILDWTVPLLPENKPRHLLGIGAIRDIFESVERGIDMLDCVIPTREARHRGFWTSRGRQGLKGRSRDDNSSLEEGCECPVCGEMSLRKKDIYELFMEKNPEWMRLLTIHNVFFFNNLMEQIRDSIREGRFLSFKKDYLNRLIK